MARSGKLSLTLDHRDENGRWSIWSLLLRCCVERFWDASGWTAHILDLDLIGSGASLLAAVAEAQRATEVHLTEQYLSTGEFTGRPAPDDDWDRFNIEGSAIALGRIPPDGHEVFGWNLTFHFVTDQKPRHLEPRMWKVQFELAPRTGLTATSCQNALERADDDV